MPTAERTEESRAAPQMRHSVNNFLQSTGDASIQIPRRQGNGDATGCGNHRQAGLRSAWGILSEIRKFQNRDDVGTQSKTHRELYCHDSRRALWSDAAALLQRRSACGQTWPVWATQTAMEQRRSSRICEFDSPAIATGPRLHRALRKAIDCRSCEDCRKNFTTKRYSGSTQIFGDRRIAESRSRTYLISLPCLYLTLCLYLYRCPHLHLYQHLPEKPCRTSSEAGHSENRLSVTLKNLAAWKQIGRIPACLTICTRGVGFIQRRGPREIWGPA